VLAQVLLLDIQASSHPQSLAAPLSSFAALRIATADCPRRETL